MFAEFDTETPVIKQTRKQRAARLTSGPRGNDLLTDAERVLLNTLREQGFDIRRSFLLGLGGKPTSQGKQGGKRLQSWQIPCVYSLGRPLPNSAARLLGGGDPKLGSSQ